MNGYTKLFSSIVTSTIWREDHPTRIVWITMLALSDREGIVEGSVPGLAHLANVTITECEAALQKLQSPDPYSRSPEFEGRRIEAIDGGWMILNRAKYRDQMPEEYRRERDRLRQQKHRNKLKAGVTASSVTECDGHEMSHQTETEKETKKREKDLFSASGDAEPRHAAIRAFIQERHAKANGIPREQVEWDGREGKALERLLRKFPTLTADQVIECARNYYLSDVNIAQRPATFIPKLLDYRLSPLNQYGTPRIFDEKHQREARSHSEATVGMT